MKRVLFPVVVAVMLVAGTSAASSIAVTGAAAIEGSYGLAVTMDGVSDNAFVQDETPNNETVYRATFKFHRNTLAFAGAPNTAASSHAIFKAWDMDQPAGSQRQHIVLGLRLNASSALRLWAKATDAGGGDVFTELGLPGLAGNPVTITVQFDQAAGTLQVCRKNLTGVFLCGTMNHNAGAHNVDQVNLGVTGAADTSTSGTYWIDSFESYRTLTTLP